MAGPRDLRPCPLHLMARTVEDDRHRKEIAMAVLTPRGARSAGSPTPVEAAPSMEAGDTLVDLFFDRAARWSERPALRHWEHGAWQTMTWAEYGTAVREVAAGLVGLGLE